MRKSWLLLIILSLILSLTIPLVYGGLDSIVELKRIPAAAFPTLLGMVLLGWLFQAARVQLLTRTIGTPITGLTAVATVISAEFAGVASPANAGEPAAYLFLFSRHGLPIARGSAIVAVDKSMDLVFFATTLPVALLLYALDSGVSHPLRLTVLVGVLLLIGLGTLIWLLYHYRAVALWLGRVLHHVPKLRRVRYRLARWLIQFRHSVNLLLTMGRNRLFLLYLFCLAHWMLRYSVLPVLLWFIGEPVPWGFLFVVQSLLMFAGQLTFLPGGGGGIELGFGALMSPYLDPITSASTLLAWRFFTFYWYLLAGAPVFIILAGKKGTELIASQDDHKPV